VDVQSADKCRRKFPNADQACAPLKRTAWRRCKERNSDNEIFAKCAAHLADNSCIAGKFRTEKFTRCTIEHHENESTGNTGQVEYKIGQKSAINLALVD